MYDKRIFRSSPIAHDEEQKFIKEAFDNNWVAPLGINVYVFEKEMVEYVEVKSGASCISDGKWKLECFLVLMNILLKSTSYLETDVYASSF